MNRLKSVTAVLTGLLVSSCIINNYYGCDCDGDGCDPDLNSQTIVLRPDAEGGKDSYVEDYPLRDYPNRNFGDQPLVQASAWTAQGIPMYTRGLIEFDLSGIPPGASLVKATLVLSPAEYTHYGTGHSDRSGSNEFVVQRIISDWDEFSVTWNTQPTTTAKSQVFVAGTPDTMHIYEIVVTKLIRDIMENQDESHGLMIKLVTEEYYRRVLFTSSDYEDPEKWPKLIIEYE